MTASHRARLGVGPARPGTGRRRPAAGSDGDSADDATADTGAPGDRAGVDRRGDHRADHERVADDGRRRRHDARRTSEPATDGVLRVPDDYATITEAVDAAVPGDLVLIAPGTYNEAVNVATDDLTIRGLDRNEVILDGEFELDNGIRILGATGVVGREPDRPELHLQRRVLHLETDGYRGVVRHTLSATATTASTRSTRSTARSSTRYAVGQPRRRRVHRPVLPVRRGHRRRHVRAQRARLLGHELGRQPATSSTRRSATTAPASCRTRAATSCATPSARPPSSATSCYSNNQPDTPAIDVALLAMGNGILIPGGVGNVDRAQPRVRPRQDRHRAGPVPRGGPERRPADRGRVGDRLCHAARAGARRPRCPRACCGTRGTTRVVGNVVVRQPASPTSAWPASACRHLDPAQLLVRQRVHHVGAGDSRRWRRAAAPARATGATRRSTSCRWLADAETARRRSTIKTAELPEPPVLEGMADPENAPVEPARAPRSVDIAAIVVPAKPAG